MGVTPPPTRARQARPHYCSTERVWKKPADTAGRIALWVRWLAWLLTFGRSGELPWVLENTCGGCWNPDDTMPPERSITRPNGRPRRPACHEPPVPWPTLPPKVAGPIR